MAASAWRILDNRRFRRREHGARAAAEAHPLGRQVENSRQLILARLAVVGIGASVIHVVLLMVLSAMTSLQVRWSEWMTTIAFPGWALFWSSGVHSDRGPFLGTAVNLLVYSLLMIPVAKRLGSHRA